MRTRPETAIWAACARLHAALNAHDDQTATAAIDELEHLTGGQEQAFEALDAWRDHATPPAPEPPASLRVRVPPGFRGDPEDTARLVARLASHTGAQMHPVAWLDATREAVCSATPAPHWDDRTLTLAARTSDRDLQELDAHLLMQGLRLVRADVPAGSASAARIWPWTATLRDRIAAAMRLAPWEVEVAVTWAPDPGAPVAAIDVGCPAWTPPSVKRDELIRALVASLLPGGHERWDVLDDALAGRWLAVYRPPARLPETVDLLAELPDTMSSDWASLPLGRDASGEPVALDLTAGPHVLAVGATGSGKTVALLALAAQALARGHRLAIVDGIKGGVDFIRLRPYAAAGWADDIAPAAALLDDIYAEAQRRKSVLRAYEAGKWSDLPADVRRRERVAPTLVIIDEYVSTVIEARVPPALARDDPRREELEAANAQRAGIALVVGKLAREARYVGIHLVLAAQRPDARYLDGELRSNLTSRVQLCPPGQLPSRIALEMVFDGDQPSQAQAELALLDDGRSRGLGVVASEGGQVCGLRVAWAPPSTLPDRLDAIGVPRGACPTTDLTPPPTPPPPPPDTWED